MENLDEYEIALQYGDYIEHDVYLKLLKWKKEKAGFRQLLGIAKDQ